MAPIIEYARAVGRQWRSLVTGSFPLALYTILVSAFRDEATVQHWWNHMSPTIVGFLLLLAFVWAQYTVLRDLFKQSLRPRKRIRHLVLVNRRAFHQEIIENSFGDSVGLAARAQVDMAEARLDKLEREILSGDFTNVGELPALSPIALKVYREFFRTKQGLL